MTQSKMFPFITDSRFNPVGGGPCPYACVYCWASKLKNRYQWSKYQGAPRIYGKIFQKKYTDDDFVFVCDMLDIFAPHIPDDIINQVLDYTRRSPARFLLLTKNPARYEDFIGKIPFNCVFGVTIESDINYPEYSQAPPQTSRLSAIHGLQSRFVIPVFISIEPILHFTVTFAQTLIQINPVFVAVGYDNYSNHLREPLLQKTEGLIQELEDANITVYRKTLRKSWSEE